MRSGDDAPVRAELKSPPQNELRRLQQRAARLRRAIAALEDSRTFRTEPHPLRQAVGGFRSELADVERRLGELSAA
jgi:hypothetical protein